MRCDVRQESDEMVCRCGLRWDANDPDPPACSKDRRAVPREPLPPPVEPVPAKMAVIPIELPLDLALSMANAYHATVLRTCDAEAAMQAAYRVFLDNLP